MLLASPSAPTMAKVGPGNLLELQEDDQLAELVSSWSFKPSIDFQQHILARFTSSVHHPSSSVHGAFHLLAVFRRYTFRLTESSVSLALHGCLGGTPDGFHVTYLKDRHFCFLVANKHVGFSVCDLRRVIMEQFDVYFHLWRDGGVMSTEVGSRRRKRAGLKFKRRKPARTVLGESCLLPSWYKIHQISSFTPRSWTQSSSAHSTAALSRNLTPSSGLSHSHTKI